MKTNVPYLGAAPGSSETVTIVPSMKTLPNLKWYFLSLVLASSGTLKGYFLSGTEWVQFYEDGLTSGYNKREVYVEPMREVRFTFANGSGAQSTWKLDQGFSDQRAAALPVVGAPQIVTLLKHLPAAVDGVITLEEGTGPWEFASVIDASDLGYQLVQENRVIVRSLWADFWDGAGFSATTRHSGWITNVAGAPAHICRNHYNLEPFWTQNNGSGAALQIESGTAEPTEFRDWYAVGFGGGSWHVEVPLNGCDNLHWVRGRSNNVRVIANGGAFQFESGAFTGRILVEKGGGSGQILQLKINKWQKTTGTDPLLEFGANTYCIGELSMAEVSDIDGRLLKLPTSYNTAAVTTNSARLSGFYSGPNGNAIDLGVVPAGGIVIGPGKFNNTTPLNGFTAATAKVSLRRCLAKNGTLMTETAIV